MRRRTLLQATASLAFLSTMPSFASQNGSLLLAGLPTDEAFSRGTGLYNRLVLRANAQGYASVVQALRNTPGHDFLALVDARHALLLEQAARDSGAALLALCPVHESHAHAVGQQLAAGTALVPQRSAGTCIALHLKT